MRTRLEVHGREHVPQDGAILAANHVSNWDPVALGLALPDLKLYGLGKQELFELPFLGRLAAACGGIPVRRGEADRDALVQCKCVLQQGYKLIMLPEGTRSRSGMLLEGKPGVVMVAQLAQVPIVPVAITGTKHMGFPWRRSTVVVRFGEPLIIERNQRNPAQRQSALTTLMQRIAAMLPQSMRGAYAELPTYQTAQNFAP